MAVENLRELKCKLKVPIATCKVEVRNNIDKVDRRLQMRNPRKPVSRSIVSKVLKAMLCCQTTSNFQIQHKLLKTL